MLNEIELKELSEAIGGFAIMTKEDEFIADHSQEIAEEYAWMIEEINKDKDVKTQTRTVKVDFSFDNNTVTGFIEVNKYWNEKEIMRYIKNNLRIEINKDAWLYQL